MTPLIHQVLNGVRPIGKFKMEAFIEQAPGNDSSGLEHELGFRPHEERANFE